MVVIVTWHKPKLLGFLTDERSAVMRAEASLKRRLNGFRHIDTLNETIAGHPAFGIRFEYNPVNTDIIQYGDLYAFKIEKVYYYIQILGRKELFQESRRLTDEFIRSVTVL